MTTINFVMVDFPKCCMIIYPQQQTVTYISKVGFPSVSASLDEFIKQCEQERKKLEPNPS